MAITGSTTNSPIAKIRSKEVSLNSNTEVFRTFIAIDSTPEVTAYRVCCIDRDWI